MYKKSEKEGMANFISWTVGIILGLLFLVFVFWLADNTEFSGGASGGILFPVGFIGIMAIITIVDKIYSLIIGKDESEK